MWNLVGKAMDPAFMAGYSVMALFVMVILMFAVVLAFYIYFSLALKTIATKLNHPNPWMAWIPIVNGALMLQLGGFHWAWIFLGFLPLLSLPFYFSSAMTFMVLAFITSVPLMVLYIKSWWHICEQRGYPGWLSLIYIGTFIPMLNYLVYIVLLVLIGFLAWHDLPSKTTSRTSVSSTPANKSTSKVTQKVAVKKSKPKKK